MIVSTLVNFDLKANPRPLGRSVVSWINGRDVNEHGRACSLTSKAD